MDPIKDSHRRAVTAVLLENQEQTLREERDFLSEAPTNAVGTGGYTSAGGQTVAGFDPVLISLIRRAMPNLVAYDLAGVQPMSGPTGLIFAMRSKYSTQGGTEALFGEADTAFAGRSATGTGSETGAAVGMGTDSQKGSNPGLLDPTVPQTGDATTYNVGQGMGTGQAEDLGDGSGAFNEMAFSIEKVTVTAKSRALKAEYSLELAQDLKAIHGLNAGWNSQTFSLLRFLLRSTVKLSVPSTTLLSQAHKQMFRMVALSTSTLTPTVAGVLRSSRVSSSKSSAMLTQSHKELVEERAT